MRPITRIQPALPVEAMKTYQIVAPKGTHMRPATCEEIGCAPFLNGWQSVIDEGTELGQAQAYYIRRNSRRSFTEHQGMTAGLVVFTFPPGQKCFEADSHRVRIGKPDLFVVRGGDWRGNPRDIQPFFHSKPEHWVEDFAEHQDKLARAYNG